MSCNVWSREQRSPESRWQLQALRLFSYLQIHQGIAAFLGGANVKTDPPVMSAFWFSLSPAAAVGVYSFALERHLV